MLLLLLLLLLNMGLLMLLLLLLLHHGMPTAFLDYFGKGLLREAAPRRQCHGSNYSGSLAIATNDKNGIT